MSSREDLEQRIRDLEGRLRDVESVQAIHRLKARYGALADSRYGHRGVKPADDLGRIATQIAELFTEDGVWDGGRTLGLATGRAEIRERFLAPTLLFSWHYFVKPEIRVDADRATGTWDILAPCTDRDGKPQWMAGTEDDEYQRVNGVWLHRRMKLNPIFLAPHETGWTTGTG